MFIFESLVPEQLAAIIVSLCVSVVYAGMILIYHLLVLFVVVVIVLALVLVYL